MTDTYDTVPASQTDDDPKTIECGNLNWITDDLVVYPDAVVPEERDLNGYFLTGEVVEDNPREISMGGWDATEWDEKHDALGHCCYWVESMKIDHYDLEDYVVDEWDGGRL